MRQFRLSLLQPFERAFALGNVAKNSVVANTLAVRDHRKRHFRYVQAGTVLSLPNRLDIDVLTVSQAFAVFHRVGSQFNWSNQIDAGTIKNFVDPVAENMGEFFIHAQYAVLKVDQYDRLRSLLEQLIEMSFLFLLSRPSGRSQPTGDNRTEQEREKIRKLIDLHNERPIRCNEVVIDGDHRHDHRQYTGACPAKPSREHHRREKKD